MSNPVSIYSNDEESLLPDTKPLNSMHDANDDEVLKTEIKIPNQVNFGRPRKHPYKPGKYKCEYCEVMCTKPSVLKKHLRAHTNERPYPCSICDRSFKTKSNLSKHMKSKSHSSNSQKVPTNKERASMMLQALSGIDQESSKSHNIEYDCIEKNSAVESSPTTSYDDRSVESEDNSADDSLKKGSISDHSQVKKTSEEDHELSSCSGMLTINSQRGPITVEVEIKLETMKQLQQGLSHMTMKKYSPASPITSIVSRNDADVRAAESIVQMANQRRLEASANIVNDINYENKLVAPKEEHRRNESIESPEQLANENFKYKDLLYLPQKSTKGSTLSHYSKSMVRNRSTNKSIPNEAQKKLKECLLESLLMKMKKKNEKGSKELESHNRNGSSPIFNKISVSEFLTESIPNSLNSVSQNTIPQKKIFTNNSISNPFALNTLISDSKSPPSLLSFNYGSGKQAVILKRTIPTNSQSPNSTTSLPSNAAILLLSPYSDQIADPQRINSPISASSLKVDSTIDVLSKVFNNTKSLYQHLCPNVTTQSVIPISTSHVQELDIDNIKEEQTIQERSIQDSPNNSESTYESDSQSCNPNTSTHTTHESDPDSSPRLRIVEDSTNFESTPDNTKNIESDEEIDVVNTDSDDTDSIVNKSSERRGTIYVNKKRKVHNECEVDSLDCDAKKLKEMEKTVTLHAPNINAENLVQDCPLNLSANRHPIIPSCQQNSQMSASVLENIYRPMVTSANSTPDSRISALTNNNPAHPQSFRDNPPLDVILPSNGHHKDFPIFEDKVLCEVCSQLIEPSKLNLHKTMHIYTDGKDQQFLNNSTSKSGQEALLTKQTFNKPRTYRCVVCQIGFRVIGHLSKHHKSKSHLQGLVNSGLLSKSLNAKIEESKVPIAEVIDQKTGNIIPGVLSKYLSDWSQATTDSDFT